MTRNRRPLTCLSNRNCCETSSPNKLKQRSNSYPWCQKLEYLSHPDACTWPARLGVAPVSAASKHRQKSCAAFLEKKKLSRYVNQSSPSSSARVTVRSPCNNKRCRHSPTKREAQVTRWLRQGRQKPWKFTIVMFSRIYVISLENRMTVAQENGLMVHSSWTRSQLPFIPKCRSRKQQYRPQKSTRMRKSLPSQVTPR